QSINQEHLGGRQILRGARAIDLTNDPLGAALKRRHEHGFEYSDCFADDSRLVVLSALDAAERGGRRSEWHRAHRRRDRLSLRRGEPALSRDPRPRRRRLVVRPRALALLPPPAQTA